MNIKATIKENIFDKMPADPITITLMIAVWLVIIIWLFVGVK